MLYDHSSSDSEGESQSLLPRRSAAAINGSDYGGAGHRAPLQCPICFDEHPPEQMRSLLGCASGHVVCAGCMEAHLRALIATAATATRLTCPAPRCEAVAEVYEVESLVDEATYQRYLQFSALDSLRQEAHAKWCVNPACAQPIIWDPSFSVVDCPACHTRFCFSCNKPPHPGLQCGQQSSSSSNSNSNSNSSNSTTSTTTPTTLRPSIGSPPSANAPDTVLEIDPAAAADPDAAYLLWKNALGAKVKPCPSCKMDVEKNMGCQHMTCSNCRHQCMFFILFFLLFYLIFYLLLIISLIILIYFCYSLIINYEIRVLVMCIHVYTIAFQQPRVGMQRAAVLQRRHARGGAEGVGHGAAADRPAAAGHSAAHRGGQGAREKKNHRQDHPIHPAIPAPPGLYHTDSPFCGCLAFSLKKNNQKKKKKKEQERIVLLYYIYYIPSICNIFFQSYYHHCFIFVYLFLIIIIKLFLYFYYIFNFLISLSMP